MKDIYFITGTDTDIGKTFATCFLIEQLKKQGKTAIALKPVASGLDSEGRNEDERRYQRAMSARLEHDAINPVRYRDFIAPHIAAKNEGRSFDVEQILSLMDRGLSYPADVCFVEGAGGWRVPINETETFPDLARALVARVILVVGVKLGCINHSLLTAEAIARDGFELAGWIANVVDPDNSEIQSSIESIDKRIGAPLLATIPYQGDNPDPSRVEPIDFKFPI